MIFKARTLSLPPLLLAALSLFALSSAARAQGPPGRLVLILADEEGRVVAAQAETGHPLLRQSAEAAARRMRVSPVKSEDGRPSKFTGVVVYTFVVR
jgi:hypothetical protein